MRENFIKNKQKNKYSKEFDDNYSSEAKYLKKNYMKDNRSKSKGY